MPSSNALARVNGLNADPGWRPVPPPSRQIGPSVGSGFAVGRRAVAQGQVHLRLGEVAAADQRLHEPGARLDRDQRHLQRRAVPASASRHRLLGLGLQLGVEGGLHPQPAPVDDVVAVLGHEVPDARSRRSTAGSSTAARRGRRGWRGRRRGLGAADQEDLLGHGLGVLDGADPVLVEHGVEHAEPVGLGLRRVGAGVELGRGGDEAGEQRRLRDVQVVHRLPEVRLGRRADAVGAAAE